MTGTEQLIGFVQILEVDDSMGLEHTYDDVGRTLITKYSVEVGGYIDAMYLMKKNPSYTHTRKETA